MDKNSKFKRLIWPQIIAYTVAFHGLLVITTILAQDLSAHHGYELSLRLSNFTFGVPLVIAFTMIYISVYLRKRKWTAWFAATALYGTALVLGTARLFLLHAGQIYRPIHVMTAVVLPAVILAGLLLSASWFTVRSDIRGFAASVRLIILSMLVMTVYGTTGFVVLDKSDFHQEISIPVATLRTIDQFGLITDDLTPYTRRAKVFQDSLSIVSIMAVAYGLASMFQPLRARFSHQAANRKLARSLLEEYGGNSEDYFKLWPHDKMFYFDRNRQSGLAYAVHRGVVLVVGDPFGDSRAWPRLLREFNEFCFTNDWTPAFVHLTPQHHATYKEYGYAVQKIGEEAIVDLKKFTEETARNKYFRHIRNRFEKQSYYAKLLMPPHDAKLIQRLSEISSEWLAQPGRQERHFLMGSFTAAYMQQSPLFVLFDKDDVPQAFLNQVYSYDKPEANIDLFRHSATAPGNSNDYLFMRFMEELHKQGFKRLNLGLCPLSGLDASDEQRSVIDSALRFVYANGDRFYSFSGLRKFKDKYDPSWQGRYVAYRGGMRNFARVVAALNKAMKV
jgi:phosphatidylglycerol lysyltransferase